MRWFRLAVASSWVGAAIVAVACREPTQITVSITTDVPCNDVSLAGGVAVRVGLASSIESNASSAIVAPNCKDGDIGTLAIVPSGGDDDQVAIQVAVASRSDPTVPAIKSVECTAQTPSNCIIAKRVLRYIPHTALDLPIRLSLKCAGVTCKKANETCVDGDCVDVTPKCSLDNTCADASPTSDASVIEASFVDVVPKVDAPSDTKPVDAPFDSPKLDGGLDAKPDVSIDTGTSGGG